MSQTPARGTLDWKLLEGYNRDMDIPKLSVTGGMKPPDRSTVMPEKQGDIRDTVEKGSLDALNETLHGPLQGVLLRNLSSSNGEIKLGAFSEKLFAQKAGPLWTGNCPGIHGSSGDMTLTSDGSLYVSAYKTLARLDPATGKALWEKTFDFDGASGGRITEAKDGTLLVDFAFNVLYGIDPATGQERWHYDTDKTGLWDPDPKVGPDGTIFTFRKDKLAVLSPQGKLKFKTRLGKYSPSILGVDSTGQSVLKSGDDTIVLSPRGKELWRASNQGCEAFFIPGDREHVYRVHNLASENRHRLEARDRETGNVLWERNDEDMGVKDLNLHHHVSAGGGKILIVDNQKDKTILCLDSGTGATLWTNTMKDGIEQRYVKMFPEGGLITIAEEGRLHAIDMEKGGFKWSLDIPPPGKAGVQVLSSKGSLFVQAGKTILGIDAATGRVFSQNDAFDTINSLLVSSDGSSVYVQEYGTLKMKAIDARGIDERVDAAMKEIGTESQNDSSKGATLVEDEFILIDGLRLDRSKDPQ